MVKRLFTENFHGSGSLFRAENGPLISNLNSSKTDEGSANFSGFKASYRNVRSKSVMRNLDNALAARGSLNPLMIVREFQGSLSTMRPKRELPSQLFAETTLAQLGCARSGLKTTQPVRY